MVSSALVPSRGVDREGNNYVCILVLHRSQQILLWLIIGKSHNHNLNGSEGETGAEFVLIAGATTKGEGYTMNPLPAARATASCV